MKPLILALPENGSFSKILATHLDAEIGIIELRKFPDGETYVRIDTELENRSVVLVATLAEPDDKILPLIFAAATARDLGATNVGFVVPYLAYMRQDRRFKAGEGVTSTYFAAILNRWIDWLVTVDPHLHRWTSLQEIYTMPSEVVHAAPLISSWIKENVSRPLLIGPDIESEQWVSHVAQEAGAPYLVLEKIRKGDRDVEVSIPDVDAWRDRTPVLVDDIISTARTMIETVGHLMQAELRSPICIGVHGIFAGDAYDNLLASGAERVVTCNTVPHSSNMIDVSGLLSDSIKQRGFGQD